MKTEKEPLVYRFFYELSLAISRYVKDCNLNYKSTLGLLMQEEVLKMAKEIYHIHDCEDKVRIIKNLIGSLYIIRLAIRLLLDLGVMKIETNISLNNLIEKNKDQLIGWQKSILKKESAENLNS